MHLNQLKTEMTCMKMQPLPLHWYTIETQFLNLLSIRTSGSTTKHMKVSTFSSQCVNNQALTFIYNDISTARNNAKRIDSLAEVISIVTGHGLWDDKRRVAFGVGHDGVARARLQNLAITVPGDFWSRFAWYPIKDRSIKAGLRFFFS